MNLLYNCFPSPDGEGKGWGDYMTLICPFPAPNTFYIYHIFLFIVFMPQPPSQKILNDSDFPRQSPPPIQLSPSVEGLLYKKKPAVKTPGQFKH